MYHVSAQGVDERMINVHYYYYWHYGGGGGGGGGGRGGVDCFSIYYMVQSIFIYMNRFSCSAHLNFGNTNLST